MLVSSKRDFRMNLHITSQINEKNYACDKSSSTSRSVQCSVGGF